MARRKKPAPARRPAAERRPVSHEGLGYKTTEIRRDLMRCEVETCHRWWSSLNGNPSHCPCGGKLELVDMEAHKASLPVRVDDPADQAMFFEQQNKKKD